MYHYFSFEIFLRRETLEEEVTINWFTQEDISKKRSEIAEIIRQLASKKSPAMSSGDWQGESYDGYQETGVADVALSYEITKTNDVQNSLPHEDHNYCYDTSAIHLDHNYCNTSPSSSSMATHDKNNELPTVNNNVLSNSVNSDNDRISSFYSPSHSPADKSCDAPICNFDFDFDWDFNFDSTPEELDLSASSNINPDDENNVTNDDSFIIGLLNLGNTCYMNCVLQALYHTPLFRSMIISHNAAADVQQVLSSLQQVFIFLRYSKRNIFSPSEFLRLARPPWFEAGRQQDCSEFLTHLLDTIQEEEKKNDIMDPQSIMNSNCSSPTIVQKVFGGRMKSSLKCRECQTKSETNYWFTDLELFFQQSLIECTKSNKISLQDMIQSYFAPELFTGDNKYLCENCDNHTEADRSVTVTSPPECLLITLLRFVLFFLFTVLD